jgi:alanyl-tRNA synthetase
MRSGRRELFRAFPELAVQRDFIGKMVRLEEKRFGKYVDVGLEKVNARLDEILPKTFEVHLHRST